MFSLGVLVMVGMTGLCFGKNLPEPPHQQPLCPLQHSCSSHNTSDDSYPSCSCDATCRLYGDCCRDSEYYNEAEQVKGVNDYICVDYSKPWEHDDFMYTKVRCSEDWDNAEVLTLCLKGNTLPDPTKRIAVTSTITGHTYVNHYCAICNGENPASLRMWYADIGCPSYTKDSAVIFHGETWGVFVPSLGLSSFKPCSFYVTMPEDIRNFTTPCVYEVNTCSDPKSEEHALTLCQSYEAPVYHGVHRYRNQHCAICNGYKEYTCGMEGRPGGRGLRGTFTMLLDFTDHTGSNLVGLNDPCNPDEVWDKRSRKCREIICPKTGEKFLYGRCVPTEDDASLSTKKQEQLCPFRHFCSSPSINDRGCSCDSTCRVYGDCCQDSEYYDEDEQTKNVNEHMCVEYTQYPTAKKHVYMRGKCSEDWDNAEVQELCLMENKLPSHNKRSIVTSTTTALTYANHYCAICNGEDPAFLRMWYTYVMCEGVAAVRNYYDYGYLTTENDDNIRSEEHGTVHDESYDFMHNEHYDNVHNEDYDIVINDGTWGVRLRGPSVPSFIPCQTNFDIPSDVEHLTTQCVPTVKTCSDAGSTEHERTLCQSYAAAVYHDDLRFRNQHCASCNGYKQHSCKTAAPTSTPRTFWPTMLFDLNDHTSLIGPCGTEEVWDQWSKKCRKIICLTLGEKFSYDGCIPIEDDVTPSSSTHTAASNTAPFDIYKNRAIDWTPKVESPRRSPIAFAIGINMPTPVMPVAGSPGEKPPELITTKTNISHSLPTYVLNTYVPANQDPQDHLSLPPNTTQSYNDCLKVQLSEAEFTRQANGSVYVPAYGRTYQYGEYEAREGGGVLVCWSAASSQKFSPTLGWVSVAGLSLSCLALVLHLTAFCLVPNLRNLSGNCLASLCLSLLAAYTTLLINMIDPPSQAGCTALAAAMYYFFLCSFSWMTAIAFDVWHTFRLTQKELRVVGGSQNHRFLAYSLCSWLLPVLPLVVLVTVDQLEPQGVSEGFLPRLGEGWCWFSHRQSLLVFFATPIAALTLMNVVFFTGTATTIAKMTRSAATPTTAPARPQRPKRYWTFLRLAVLMGLTWTTGILAGSLDLEPLWYVFVVLNSLQGVFIFLAFTCRTKVFQEVSFRGGKLLQWVVPFKFRRPLQPDTSLEVQEE